MGKWKTKTNQQIEIDWIKLKYGDKNPDLDNIVKEIHALYEERYDIHLKPNHEKSYGKQRTNN